MQIIREPLAIPGSVLEEREIPSDTALVTPLVVRIADLLAERGLIEDADRMKIELCLDEAITNAVRHGNRSDFGKLVRVKVFEDETCWGIVVQDEGDGFSLESLTDATQDEKVWAESGRGIPLMTLYMDEVTFYDGGRTLMLKLNKN